MQEGWKKGKEEGREKGKEGERRERREWGEERNMSMREGRIEGGWERSRR